MDKTTEQLFALLPSSQRLEILETAIKGLQEKMRVIVSNLPADKLIIAHDYLTKLANNEPAEVPKKQSETPMKHRPLPTYTSTPDDSDVDYSDMPPLVEDVPKVVKNIYNGWAPCTNNTRNTNYNCKRK